MTSWPTTVLRCGDRPDAEVLSTLHRRSRAAAMPWLPVVHDEASTRWWVEHVVLAEQDVVVAEVDGTVVGFSAVAAGWLEHLYVAPEAQGRGAGSALLAAVLDRCGGSVDLRVFARNAAARAFYERRGFVLVGEGDGAGNEEGEADLTYRWSPGGRPGPRRTARRRAGPG